MVGVGGFEISETLRSGIRSVNNDRQTGLSVDSGVDDFFVEFKGTSMLGSGLLKSDKVEVFEREFDVDAFESDCEGVNVNCAVAGANFGIGVGVRGGSGVNTFTGTTFGFGAGLGSTTSLHQSLFARLS